MDRHEVRFYSATPDLLGSCEIHTSTHTDYAYRVFVTTPDWSAVISGLAVDTG